MKGNGAAAAATSQAAACSPAGIEAFALCKPSTIHTTRPAAHSRESCKMSNLDPGRLLPPAESGLGSEMIVAEDVERAKEKVHSDGHRRRASHSADDEP